MYLRLLNICPSALSSNEHFAIQSTTSRLIRDATVASAAGIRNVNSTPETDALYTRRSPAELKWKLMAAPVAVYASTFWVVCRACAADSGADGDRRTRRRRGTGQRASLKLPQKQQSNVCAADESESIAEGALDERFCCTMLCIGTCALILVSHAIFRVR